MTKTKSTKRALLMSALALLMCVSMLIGSTFAWFTDSVTSAGNIIKSGTLDVEMYWADGTKAVPTADADWTDASTGAIFDYDKWEPGYTEVRHIKIENNGTLALKYQLSISANGEVTDDVADLVDVIDVYYVDPAAQVNGRNDLTEDMKLGTLSQVLDEIDTTASGNLKAGEEHTVTLALKMQESAGNDYQNKSFGTDFKVMLSAIQLDFEEDSFGPDYDEGLDPETTYVSTFTELKNAARNGGKFALNADLNITDKNEFFYGSYVTAVYNDMILDLNGHSITIDVPMESVTKAPVLFYVYSEGASLTIIGDGDVIAKNDAFLVFPRNVSEGVYIYGGNYYNIDKTSGAKNDINAIVYSEKNNNIHIYGGTFTFKNVNGHCGAFNVYDNRGAEITLYEGVLLSGSNYYTGSDADEIHLDDGCTLQEVMIDGKTWYQVVKGSGVSSASDLITALDTEDAYIVLQNDVALDQSVTVNKSVTLNLNNKTLTTMGLEFAADATIENGTVASGGNTNLVPHLKATAGTLTMDNVTVDVKHHLNANVYWSEATGMEVQNAKAILNNCNVKINNVTKAQWVYSYGISLNNAEITVNGGSITAECVAGTAANGPTNPNAISTMGECTATLNNVNVTAMYYATTVNGHATVNTTDKGITSANIVDNRGGSHTLNYID